MRGLARSTGPAGAALVVVMALALSACGIGATASPTPPPGPALTVPQLKLTLVRELGPLWYCDPDFFPIQRQDELDAARERWPEVLADAEAYAAITANLGIDPTVDLRDDEMLAVYRAWKVLNAIALEPTGDAYQFDYLAQPASGAAEGTRTTGTIGSTGQVTVEAQGPAPEPMCPICLAAWTRIEVPGGDVAVDHLRVGDTVWTLDASGRRVPASVLAVGSTPVPATHRVARLVLADGRSVTASPGHPLADGRLLGGLRPGDVVGGSSVVRVEDIPYRAAATWDLVVSGATGAYLVDGVALGSTLD